MTWLRILLSRLTASRSKEALDDDLDDEIRAHIDMQTDENIRRGMTKSAARQAALQSFGKVDRLKDDYRDRRGLPFLEVVFQDIRYAARSLRKNPRFAAVAILTLALGIGGSTAVFSVIRAVMLEPLPYKNSDRLMVLDEKSEKDGKFQPYSLSYVNFEDWSAAQHSFDELALVRRVMPYKVFGRTRTFANVRMVSANFFLMLGVTPIVGRDFTASDDRPGATPSIVLSYSGWQKLFGPEDLGTNEAGKHIVTSPTSLLGEKLLFNGLTYNVIGVLPRDFKFFTFDGNVTSDGYIPIHATRETWMIERSGRPRLGAIGHLKPGATVAGAQTELEGIARRLAIAYPESNEDRGAAVIPIFDAVVSAETRHTLDLLLGAVVIVLLISCANVANLLLARGTTRQKEIAIRVALGGRWRVGQQLITESLVLALIGGSAGLFVAIVGTDLLAVTAPVRLPRVETIGIDWHVLLFSACVTLLTGMAFGIVPTLQALRADPQTELKEGGTSSVTNRHRVQHILIVGEVALALMLLVAAGLVFHSTQKALDEDPGFDPTNVRGFSVILSPGQYDATTDTREFYKRLVARFSVTPEVQAVSLASGGFPRPAAVDPAYLKLMGLRLIKGRFFDERDTKTSAPVIVIEETLARTRFKDEDPIGKPFLLDLKTLMPGSSQTELARPREVIGVVSHMQILGLRTDDPMIQFGLYLPNEQLPDEIFSSFPPTVVLKTTWPDDKILEQIERVVHSVNPDVDVTGIVKMQDAIEIALISRRFVTNVLGIFAISAFVLAALGIFGLMTYTVSQRTQEIGLRMALGAQAAHVVRMVVKQAAILSGIGIGLGLIASFWMKSLIDFFVVGISLADPITYSAAVSILFSVALAAAYLPAFRASRLEPITALRGIRGATSWFQSIAPTTSMPSISVTTLREPSIEVANLQKTYEVDGGKKTIPALDSVSLTVEPGTIFGLIGQNGAGKTSLVKILLGLSAPTSGSARLLGCMPGDPILNRRIGYLPEHMKIPRHFVAATFMRYMGKLNGVDSVTMDARIPELLEKVGLGGVTKHVNTYSKGMHQRLGLAQALLNDPEILFLDEPTDGLDPLGRIFVRDLLVQLRAEGKTIFLNSHLLSEIELICDHIVILDKGIVACTTTPEEFTRGTGEYVMRIDVDESLVTKVQQVTETLVGRAVWQDGVLRFKPRNAAHLNDFLDELRHVPVTILSLEPIRLSLEQFFIKVVTERNS